MPDALLSRNDQMEALSRAYVSAVAARAAYDISHPGIDRDSIDVVVSARGEMRPQIGIQLKATTTIVEGCDEFSFSLRAKNYNDLRIVTLVPRLLVVFALPSVDEDWLSHSASELILRRCAYWKSLKGMPDVNTDTTTITMNTAQVFDVPSLVSLMDKSRRAEAL